MQFIMHSHHGLSFNRYLFVGKEVFDVHIHSLTNQKMKADLYWEFGPNSIWWVIINERVLPFFNLLNIKKVLSI